jgi:mannitol-specific phosphotransferase system IIBC component
MEKGNKDSLGYFHCEGENCKFISKKVSKLVYFKGKRLCSWCKRKASKSNNYIPKLNPAESTLKKEIRLPREKDKKEVTEQMREWAENQNKEIKLSSVGISKVEVSVLKDKIKKNGIDYVEGQNYIKELKTHVLNTHKTFRQASKQKVNFKDKFEAMIQ